MRFVRTLLLVVALATPVTAQPQIAAPASGRHLIRTDSLMAHVRWLADDAREGRGTGEPGCEAAAEWLAQRFSDLGLEPAGDHGTFLQSYSVTIGSRMGDTNHLVVHRGSDREALELETEFIPFGFSENAAVNEVPLVFVGYGITAEEIDYDDYAGMDVEGKVVLMLRHEPQQHDSESEFAGNSWSRHAFFRAKAVNAERHGAAGMILITGPFSDGADEDVLVPLTDIRSIGGSGMIAVHAKRAAFQHLFDDAGVDLREWCRRVDETLNPESFVMERTTVSVATEVIKEKRTTANVVARLPGTDPQAGAVVLGAHYDHLGRGNYGTLSPNKRGDIHNGADDNASGTAALVELARVFSRAELLSRDLVFVAFSGEELGLLGSAHFVTDPTVPLDQVQAMLNMDMIGRPKEKHLTIGGVGSSPALQPMLEKLTHGSEWDISWDSGGFGPSDHTSFYTQDVPVLFFFSGLHNDYHRPGDDWDKIDPDGITETVRLVHDVTLDLANRPQRIAFSRAAENGGTHHADMAGSEGIYGGGQEPGAFLGVVLAAGDEAAGALLAGVRRGSPAREAGLQSGDIITGLAGRTVDSPQDLVMLMREHEPGDTVEIVALRDGDAFTVTAVLGVRE